jgi:LysR family transcriptional regulator, glycine cleavage system transcriptional activator
MVRRLPPLNAVRAFEAAARHGGFAPAAAELNVTPAAISQQVKALEETLGLKLFRRLARGLVLTDAGRAYLPGLSDGLDLVAQATTQIRGRTSSGLVTISVLPALAAGWLVPRLARFRQLHPGVDIAVRAERRLVDFAREDVDLAIRFGRGNFKDFVAHHLMDETVFAVASPRLLHGAVPLSEFADLRRHVLLHDVDAHPQQPWMSWRAWFAREGLAESDAARGLFFNDSLVLLAAAVAGQGVALGRGPHLGEHLAAGRLVRLFEKTWRAEWSYYVVAPPSHAARPPVRHFIDWLRHEATSP